MSFKVPKMDYVNMVVNPQNCQVLKALPPVSLAVGSPRLLFRFNDKITCKILILYSYYKHFWLMQKLSNLGSK